MTKGRETLLAITIGGVALAVYRSVFLGLLPNEAVTMGHDWSYFLPHLLNGFFWFEQNGLFRVPWFTPALGGGVPFYPGPLSQVYSLPQFLSFAMDPLAAVRVSMLVFAGLGFTGMYLLLRRVIGTEVWASLVGAVVFMYNGYFAHRFLIGHLNHHAFILVPWVALFVLRPLPETGKVRRFALDAVLAGLVWAYLFQTGDLYNLPVSVLVVAALALGLTARSGWSWSWPGRLVGGVAVSGLLCASKLAATTAFLGSFPRSEYVLPGASSVAGALRLLGQSLFGKAPVELVREIMVNAQWAIERHELEFSVTGVPLVLLAAGVGTGLVTWVRRRPPVAWARTGAAAAGLVVVLAVPVALNVYEPGWNAFLKQLPVLKNASILIRTFALYIPLVAVASAVALGSMPLPGQVRPVVAAAAIVAVFSLNAGTERAHYAQQPYSPAGVVASWRAVRGSGVVPPVNRIVAPPVVDGKLTVPIDRNDTLALGASQIVFYEPVFGYGLERFPFGVLRPGPPLPETGETLNVKNPACFVFPSENGGEPGTHFRRDQLEEAAAFLAYRPFPFVRPARQRIADGLSLVSLVAVVGFLAAYPFLGRRRWPGEAA